MATEGRKAWRGLRMLLATLALAATLLAAAAAVRGTCVRLLADHWRRQLATLPEAEAAMLVCRAARLGKPGIPVLVEAMASSRPNVAQAGCQTLLDEVTRWKTLPASESSPRLAILASDMARQAECFSAEVRPQAAELAGQILLWPLDESKANRARLIADCHRILESSRSVRPSSSMPQLAGGTANRPKPLEAAGPPTAERAARALPTLPDIADLPGRGLPGGGLSNEAITPGLLPVDGVVARLAAARAEGMPEPDGNEQEDPGRREGESLKADLLEGDRNTAPAQGPALHPLAYLRSAMQANEVDTSESAGTARWATVDTFDVLRALGSPDAAEAEAAHRELERRGFTPVDFEIARQMLDRDPAVRARLARRLPALTSIDAASWLLELSRDPDPGVRQTAIGILATTGDAELLARLEQMAAHDPAPSVQRLVEEIAKRRKASSR